MSETIIRAATESDLEAVGRLGALLVKSHHDFDPKRFIASTPQTPQGYASFLATQLNEPKVVILVAELEGKVVGYVYAGIEGRDYMALRGPAGAIYDILVEPKHRSIGIGRKLLKSTIDELEQRGARQIVLSTADQNESAQRLFACEGFRRTMIEMTRDLDDAQSS